MFLPSLLLPGPLSQKGPGIAGFNPETDEKPPKNDQTYRKSKVVNLRIACSLTHLFAMFLPFPSGRTRVSASEAAKTTLREGLARPPLAHFSRLSPYLRR